MRKKKLKEMNEYLTDRPYDSNVDMRGLIVFLGIVAVLIVIFVTLFAFKMI